MEDQKNISLVIGGVGFTVRKNLLKQCDFFKSIFEDIPDEEAVISIGGTSLGFMYLLEYLDWCIGNPEDSGNGHLCLFNYPKKYENVLDYYGADKTRIKFHGDIAEYEETIKNLRSHTKDLQKNVLHLSNELNSTKRKHLLQITNIKNTLKEAGIHVPEINDEDEKCSRPKGQSGNFGYAVYLDICEAQDR